MEAWTSSQLLSRSFWAHYNQVIGQTSFVSHELAKDDCDVDDSVSQHNITDTLMSKQESEYLEFIRVTRQHQAEREKLKKLELIKNPELNSENYYTDISQVNTLVEDNLVDAPSSDEAQLTDQERLKQLYGDSYDRIRSTEMWLDDYFNQSLKKLSPPYWPAIPINLKPYLGERNT